MVAIDLAGAGNCVDCGLPVLICEHVTNRIVDPVVAFQARVIGELQAELADRTRERDEALTKVDEVTKNAVDTLLGNCTADDHHGIDRMSFASFCQTEGVRCSLCVAVERDQARAERAAVEVALAEHREALEHRMVIERVEAGRGCSPCDTIARVLGGTP